METMWSFAIGRFEVRAEIEPCFDPDLSWCETGETANNIASGLWDCFNTRVSVWLNGVMIGSDWLCESIYESPQEFFSDHRSADAMNRNCSLMRAERGDNVVICHYFPDMVREAISEAREWLASAQLEAA